MRLLLITYDPEFDTPVILEQFGTRHGLRFDEETIILRLDPKEKTKLFDELQVAVNFNNSGVNIHGIQLLLFDRQGTWVRTYHTVIWNNDEVLRDLRALTLESHEGY